MIVSRAKTVMRMMWPTAGCDVASTRLDAAIATYERADTKLRKVALDVVDESVAVASNEYPTDRYAAAVADVTRRYREAHGRT